MATDVEANTKNWVIQWTYQWKIKNIRW